jgi:hypothetical protein
MSFGFAIGDLIGVANLAWQLYQNCYRVIQDSPQDIKELIRDLSTIYGVLKRIEEDLASNDSVIKSHGERRTQLLQSMISNLRATLIKLQELVLRYQRLAAKKGWKNPEVLRDKFKWIVDQRKIGGIRQDLTFHISSFQLLLASMGKWVSLQSCQSQLNSASDLAPVLLTSKSSSLCRIEQSLSQLRLASSGESQTAVGSISDNDGEPYSSQVKEEDGGELSTAASVDLPGETTIAPAIEAEGTMTGNEVSTLS